MLDEDFDYDPEIDGYLSLDRVGEYIKDPKYIIYLDIPGSLTFGANEVHKNTTWEDLAHYMLMREKGITKAEAIAECIKTKPTIVLHDKAFLDPIHAEYRVFN